VIGAYLHWQPDIAPSSFIASSAEVIGRVSIGEESSVWHQSVLRGGYLYAGIPARKRRALTEKETAFLAASARRYAELARTHRS